MLFRGRKSEPPVHFEASPPPTPSPKQYRSDTEIYYRYPELCGLKQFIALSASTFGNYAATKLHESITNLGPEMLRQHAKEWKEEANAIDLEYRALYESLRTASGEPLAGLDPNAEVLLDEVQEPLTKFLTTNQALQERWEQLCSVHDELSQREDLNSLSKLLPPRDILSHDDTHTYNSPEEREDLAHLQKALTSTSSSLSTEQIRAEINALEEYLKEKTRRITIRVNEELEKKRPDIEERTLLHTAWHVLADGRPVGEWDGNKLQAEYQKVQKEVFELEYRTIERYVPLMVAQEMARKALATNSPSAGHHYGWEREIGFDRL